jgi:hypothetical protein
VTPAPAAPLVNPRPLLCPRCGAPWGVEGDDCVALGGALINVRVPLVCGRCRNVWGWRPGGRRNTPPGREKEGG